MAADNDQTEDVDLGKQKHARVSFRAAQTARDLTGEALITQFALCDQ
jgi:hypothetical protein